MNSLRIWQTLSKCMASFAILTWIKESRTNRLFQKRKICWFSIFNRFSSCMFYIICERCDFNLFLNELVKILDVKSTLAIGNSFPNRHSPSNRWTEYNRNRKKSIRLEQNWIKRWTNTPAICWISNFDIIAVRLVSHIWYDKFARVLS